MKSGGKNFDVIPCLNDNDDHINLIKNSLVILFYKMNIYLTLKALHLIAVISWMAGLLYLPRIFVYHVENKDSKETCEGYLK